LLKNVVKSIGTTTEGRGRSYRAGVLPKSLIYSRNEHETRCLIRGMGGPGTGHQGRQSIKFKHWNRAKKRTRSGRERTQAHHGGGASRIYQHSSGCGNGLATDHIVAMQFASSIANLTVKVSNSLTCNRSGLASGHGGKNIGVTAIIPKRSHPWVPRDLPHYKSHVARGGIHRNRDTQFPHGTKAGLWGVGARQTSSPNGIGTRNPPSKSWDAGCLTRQGGAHGRSPSTGKQDSRKGTGMERHLQGGNVVYHVA